MPIRRRNRTRCGEEHLAADDVTIDVTVVTTLEPVSGNVGINLASGVGSVQFNSVTTVLSF